jgi:hypothetical protein
MSSVFPSVPKDSIGESEKELSGASQFLADLEQGFIDTRLQPGGTGSPEREPF